MSAHAPSIFNDVIGPVMRGASSSHCAAALRIGRMARSMMAGQIDSVLVELETTGSLATTYQSQGSEMGLVGGLLGWQLTDERLLNYGAAMEQSGIDLRTEVHSFPTNSPNIYKLTLSNQAGQHELVADSTGGGMIEIQSVDGVALSMIGDCHETLIFPKSDAGALHTRLLQDFESEQILLHADGKLIEIKSPSFLSPQTQAELRDRFEIQHWLEIEQVLPVATPPAMALPFTSCAEMLDFNANEPRELWQLGVLYEAARGGLAEEEVLERMEQIILTLQDSVRIGLAGTEFQDRILGPQSGSFEKQIASGGLLDCGMLNEMILQISAMMEVKSSMGVIVAAPTAGACGALPGVVLGAGKILGLSLREMTQAMLAAGMIGTFIATHSTFAAEKAGCQAECGAGSGMAAAALVGMAGGNLEQSLVAASMALQNMLGLICDPVAKRVEVPCLGRNVLAASNAVSCANMALAGFDAVIPLDEVIEAMDGIGKTMPCELRCTGLGGLAVTPTAMQLESDLEKKCST
ncbi:MAG: serine dehydratase [Planctomycetes bacterium]|nr:serine dehydratase [Planctomycetota bacterium]MCP4770837.1 serine dehydratase [Planctomycetota bacterium]MCP4860209.1 serine dehydratase [Planctomycetota bacterium]